MPKGPQGQKRPADTVATMPKRSHERRELSTRFRPGEDSKSVSAYRSMTPSDRAVVWRDEAALTGLSAARWASVGVASSRRALVRT